MSTEQTVTAASVRRRVLSQAVAAICMEGGYDSIDKAALETLTEMTQSFMSELGRSSRSFAELAGRVHAILGDVVMALIEMGQNVESFEVYCQSKRSMKCTSLAPPVAAPLQKTPSTLSTGDKQSHPPHIPNHFPEFPDPHAYVWTPTHKQPVTEYEAIREKASVQKRNIELGLLRFMTKTGPTQSLFPSDEGNPFPLIATKPCPHPYLNALLPKDQLFEEDEEPVQQTAAESPTKRMRRPAPAPIANESEIKEENEDTEMKNESKESSYVECDTIDNPYLRQVKMPRKRKIM